MKKTATWFEGNQNNQQIRLGLRAYITREEDTSPSTNKIQPFVEMNCIYNSQPYEVKMDGQNITQHYVISIVEVKLVLEASLAKHTSMWLNLARQFGKAGYWGTCAIVGIKYSF